MEKSCRKCAASPRLLFYFGKQPKTAIACKEFLQKQDILEGIIKSLLKIKLYFFFPNQSLLIDKVIKNKKGLELVTSPSSGYKISSKKFIY